MIRELWYENRIPGDYKALGEEYGVSPILARLCANRLALQADFAVSRIARQVEFAANRLDGQGDNHSRPTAVEVRKYLENDLEPIYGYEKLPDIEKCTDILEKMITEGKHIRVIGDYDIDGVCSTYILTIGLHKANAKVDHAIPHRITDGYGVNDRLIKGAAAESVDCVITCDNGIAAAAQIELAHSFGMTVIVTDHHEVPYHMSGEDKVEDLPDADAVVDIKRSDSEYGFTEICGAVVALKVIFALYDRLGIDRAEADELIELAAFATIGDIMPLVGENRTLVSNGLQRLENTSNIGMQALIKAQGVENTKFSPYHVGFVLGPCINATGRLATADNAFELLAAEDVSEAEKLADMLVAMNNDRKDMTDKGVKRALELAESEDMAGDKVLVIYLSDTHESVAGIIAGRVRESTGKPCFVLTDGEDCIKGSGRSIERYDMHEAMTEVADLFEKFGGHKMAGGLSLADGVTPELLRERLNNSCTLTDDDLIARIRFDMQLPFSWVNWQLISDIEKLEPFGVGNSKPIFAAKDVVLRNMKICGKLNNVLKCRAYDAAGASMDAVCFKDAEGLMNRFNEKGSVKILYSPDVNEYRGERSLQIVIEHFS